MRLDLEYGDRSLRLEVPDQTERLAIRHHPPMARPAAAIRGALAHPVGGPTLEQQVAARSASQGKAVSDLTVAITISDHTRPVPYSAEREDGILMPVLEALLHAGIRDRNITIVVGTGTHLATSREWKRSALGAAVVDRFRLIDHDCTSPDLRGIGSVQGIEVRVNEPFLSADLRVATSLVEPHFMAGVSGGAKAVCPGLINLEATRGFHGPEWMDDPRAASLSLDGNPCYRFAVEVARRVGVHFSVNCLVDKEGRLTGIVAGELEEVHARAVQALRSVCAIPCRQEYDVLVTHGGRVAVNHYQTAKAACAVMPIAAPGAMLVLAASNADPEPVGKPEYRLLLARLRESGPAGFLKLLRDPGWQFVPDQWEVQKWAQCFLKLGGFDRLIYCTTGIPAEELARLPGRSGDELVPAAGPRDPQAMVQEAVRHAVRQKRDERGTEPRCAVLIDGPYGVPVLG